MLWWLNGYALHLWHTNIPVDLFMYLCNIGKLRFEYK